MTGFTEEQKAALSAKLDASHVKSRSQAGRTFSYVEGWHAIAEANRIFGFDMWHRDTIEMRQLGEPREIDGKWRVAYMAKVRIEVFAGDRAIIREGCGYGSGIDRDVGSAHESALKEAETDAMKRALMTFGNPFGLALYDKTQENVEKAEPSPRAAPKARGETEIVNGHHEVTYKPQTKADAYWAAFWRRPSYELKGANITDPLTFGKAFEEACKRAPAMDSLLKLEEDNLTDLAALNNQSPHASKQAKAAFGAAQLHLTNKAA